MVADPMELLIISINLKHPKINNSYLKKWYFPMFSRYVFQLQTSDLFPWDDKQPSPPSQVTERIVATKNRKPSLP